MSINKTLGEDKPNICEVCGRKMPPEALNYEAKIHFGEKLLKCIDRKSCEKAKRKK